MTVLVAMVVAMTLGPALIATFGSVLFLPGPGWYRKARRAERTGDDTSLRRALRPARMREQLARIATARPLALLIVVGCAAALLAAGWQATGLRLGSPLIRALPASTAAASAEAAAAKGFAAGILSPTEIVILGAGLGRQIPELASLQRELARQPGVAGVVGPASLPAVAKVFGTPVTGPAGAAAAAALPNPMLARSGTAARYGIIYSTDPLGAQAVRQVRALEGRLPGLARAAGLSHVRFETGGETAAIGEAIGATTASLGQLALIMLAITFVLLAIFLRALLAPLYLLAASVLALAATIGVVVWVFQGRLGYDGIVFYVPFTVAVLLISLGADYNVFVVGRIWEEAARRPLRDAIAVAGSQASRAITVAGIALAASFALLALIPLQQFREVALAMAAGVVIDAVVVRSVLVPAVVALFGRVGMWPGRRGLSGAGTPRVGARRRLGSPSGGAPADARRSAG